MELDVSLATEFETLSNLAHYTEVLADLVKKQFCVPSSYTLLSFLFAGMPLYSTPQEGK